MFQKIRLEVLYAVHSFRWSGFEAVYPPELQEPAEAMPLNYHLACKVNSEGIWPQFHQIQMIEI